LQKYIEALETLNWTVILDGAKKEASRQVVEMTKWLDHQEEHNPEGLEALGVLPEAIRKAGKYRMKIYNRNKDLKAIDKKLETEEDPVVRVELQNKRGEYEAEQYMVTGRVLKIYTIVIANVSLTLYEDEQEDLYGELDDDVYGETS
jgi:hypothetical protein